MALEGQLSEFGIEEILQLISVQQKSGFLVLKFDQDMVFYFDRGVLISTRDRRNPGNDPLERHLRRYGFFTPEQWAHIDYVLSHASLDLTEVILSENLLDEKSLTTVLQAVAQDLIHQGMKLKRGSYLFTATNDVNSGIRGRIAMDVQGLLMEGARRCDEEPRLQEKFSSLSMTFQRGAKTPQANELGEASTRLLRLALAGRTLGEITQQGRTSAFTVRELLANLCEMGALVPVQAELAEVIPLPTRRGEARSRRGALRQPAFTIACAVLLLGAGAVRWRPVLLAPLGGTGAAGGSAAALAGPAPGQASGETIRLAQLRDDVEQAILLFHHQHDTYPASLAALVAEGFLSVSTVATLEGRGWRYKPADRGRSYQFGPSPS